MRVLRVICGHWHNKAIPLYYPLSFSGSVYLTRLVANFTSDSFLKEALGLKAM